MKRKELRSHIGDVYSLYCNIGVTRHIGSETRTPIGVNWTALCWTHDREFLAEKTVHGTSLWSVVQVEYVPVFASGTDNDEDALRYSELAGTWE